VSDGDKTPAGPWDAGQPGRTVVIQLRQAISLIERFPALAGVDLTVTEGEIILLRGPNGAGKSTLLRLCAGLAPLNGGRGEVLGHDLSSRRERRELRRQTGLLAHATFLYDELTVEENLMFWARANRLDEASVEPVLDRLALANRLRHVRVANLSAGQRRRASLAVLVCRRPRLWLLDEPHAGLDVNGRDFVDGLIKHAVAFGGTVLLASHDFDRAAEIATRTVVVAGGQVQETDPASQPDTPEGWMARRPGSAAPPPRWGHEPDDAPPADPAAGSPLVGRPSRTEGTGSRLGGRAGASTPAPPPLRASRAVAGEPAPSAGAERVQSGTGVGGAAADTEADASTDTGRPGPPKAPATEAGPGSRWRGRRRATAESG